MNKFQSDLKHRGRTRKSLPVNCVNSVNMFLHWRRSKGMRYAAQCCMRWDSFAVRPHEGQIEVTLDGLSIALGTDHCSLTGIRTHLEMLALEQQRILCSFAIDGQPINLGQTLEQPQKFSRIEAETIALDEIPLQILRTALDQTVRLGDRTESALALICINNASAAREIWWQIARDLKEPLLTLSLLPDGICGPANGRASLTQLRKWQLQQLASLIREVNEACQADDTTGLIQALEKRLLPWLQSLRQSIGLWHETVAAGSRFAAQSAA